MNSPRHVQRRRVALIIPFLAAVALYAPTLKFERTLDDVFHTSTSEGQKTKTWQEIWTEPYWPPESGGLYRPVLTTTFWLEERFQLSLAVRHGVNVLLHGLVTVFLVRLAMALGLAAWPAMTVGLLFALHPVHVETVAGLVGRAELLAALWMLVALRLHERNRTPKQSTVAVQGSEMLAAAFLAFLAAGSKESAWALPFYVAVLHVALKKPFRTARNLWAGYVLGFGAHMLMRRAVLGGWLNSPDVVTSPGNNPLVTLTGFDRLLGGLRVVGINLEHLVFPRTLSPDYSGPQIPVTGGLEDPRLWGGIALVAATALIPIAVLRRLDMRSRPALMVGAAWLFGTTMLVMNLVFNLGTIMGDRLLYWPSIAWLLLLGGIFTGVAERAKGRARRAIVTVFAGLAVVTAVAYTTRGLRYLPAWKNDATLFTAAAEATPEAPRVWFNFGRVLRDEERTDEALFAYRRARELVHDYQAAWAGEASILVDRQDWDAAAEALARALELDPEDTISRLNEGVLWLRTGETDKAVERFREVSAGNPHLPEAAFNLARAEEQLGRFAEAAVAWRRYLEARPDDPDAMNRLAWLLATELNQPEEAERLALRSVAARPNTAGFLDTLAEALFRQGKREEAIDAARRALALDDSPYFRDQLERFLEPGPPKGARP